MPALRIAFALFLALLATLLGVTLLLHVDSHHQTSLLGELARSAAAFCLAASSFYFFWPRQEWESKLACPHCKSRGSLRLSVLGQQRVNVPLLLLGGILPSILYTHSRKKRFQCDVCGKVSDLRTTGARLAGVSLLVLIFSVVAIIYSSGT